MSARYDALGMATATEQKQRIGYRGYLAIGVLSALVALVFVPIVFGPITIVCGVQVFRLYNEYHGMALVALGGVTTVVGVIIGYLSTFAVF